MKAGSKKKEEKKDVSYVYWNKFCEAKVFCWQGTIIVANVFF